MKNASSTFRVSRDFTCVDGLLQGGHMQNTTEAVYEEGARFTLEDVTKSGCPKIYFDHAKSMFFTESRLAFLLKEKMVRELCPVPAMDE